MLKIATIPQVNRRMRMQTEEIAMRYACMLAVLLLQTGCRSSHQSEIRIQTYDAVARDMNVVSHDLETRAVNHATSAYTQSVATLEIQTERSKALLREKAKAEQTDPLVFESWLQAADNAHDAKLRELGAVKDEYLRLWGQRYATLQRDSRAIEALTNHELKYRDDSMKAGLISHFEQIVGVPVGVNPLNTGAIGAVGGADASMAPPP